MILIPKLNETANQQREMVKTHTYSILQGAHIYTEPVSICNKHLDKGKQICIDVTGGKGTNVVICFSATSFRPILVLKQNMVDYINYNMY